MEKFKVYKLVNPYYNNYKLYGDIAAFSFDKGVIEEATDLGFMVFTQDNDTLKYLNASDFEPNEIK